MCNRLNTVNRIAIGIGMDEQLDTRQVWIDNGVLGLSNRLFALPSA